jgi:hypothetical protein
MKRALFIMVILFASLTAASPALCAQAGGTAIYSPQVQERERRLFQGFAQDQLQALGQHAALLEGMPDPGGDPLTAAEGILGAAKVRGLARADAAFAVLALSGRHLDEDLREMAGAIQAMSESQLALQSALSKLQAALGEAWGRKGAAGAGKVMQGPPAGTAVVAPLAGLDPARSEFGVAMGLQSLQTAHYRYAYWRLAPLAPVGFANLTQEQQRAEAEKLTAKLEWLNGMLAAMRGRQAAGGQRLQALALALERMPLRSREPRLRE